VDAGPEVEIGGGVVFRPLEETPEMIVVEILIT